MKNLIILFGLGLLVFNIEAQFKNPFAEIQKAVEDVQKEVSSGGNISATQANLMAQLTDALGDCLLYTSPSPRDQRGSRMPSSA